jgi:hypothetical protein
MSVGGCGVAGPIGPGGATGVTIGVTAGGATTTGDGSGGATVLFEARSVSERGAAQWSTTKVRRSTGSPAAADSGVNSLPGPATSVHCPTRSACLFCCCVSEIVRLHGDMAQRPVRSSPSASPW